MISFHNITSLLKQGFTEEQIQKIDSVFSGSPTAPAPADPDPKPAPAPNPDPDPDPAPPKDTPAKATDPAPLPPEPQPQPQPQVKEESETEKMLKEMLGIMRRGNINQMQVNTPTAETAEQILAKVLNPDM